MQRRSDESVVRLLFGFRHLVPGVRMNHHLSHISSPSPSLFPDDSPRCVEPPPILLCLTSDSVALSLSCFASLLCFPLLICHSTLRSPALLQYPSPLSLPRSRVSLVQRCLLAGPVYVSSSPFSVSYFDDRFLFARRCQGKKWKASSKDPTRNKQQRSLSMNALRLEVKLDLLRGRRVGRVLEEGTVRAMLCKHAGKHQASGGVTWRRGRRAVCVGGMDKPRFLIVLGNRSMSLGISAPASLNTRINSPASAVSWFSPVCRHLPRMTVSKQRIDGCGRQRVGERTKKVIDFPDFPPRPVRPIRWM